MYDKQANVKYSYSRPKKDLTGKVFNDLKVLEWLGFKEVGTAKKRRSVYRCECVCGNLCEVDQTSISGGNTKSCGCRLGRLNPSYKGEHYSCVSYLMNNYKQSAKKRGLEFSLSRDFFSVLISGNCHYCGVPPNRLKYSDNSVDTPLRYNGIDRVDNGIGYTPDNSISCCKECNFLKKDSSYIDFITRVFSIVTNTLSEGRFVMDEEDCYASISYYRSRGIECTSFSLSTGFMVIDSVSNKALVNKSKLR